MRRNKPALARAILPRSTPPLSIFARRRSVSLSLVHRRCAGLVYDVFLSPSSFASCPVWSRSWRLRRIAGVRAIGVVGSNYSTRSTGRSPAARVRAGYRKRWASATGRKLASVTVLAVSEQSGADPPSRPLTTKSRLTRYFFIPLQAHFLFCTPAPRQCVWRMESLPRLPVT